jgi:hypothetical protein
MIKPLELFALLKNSWKIILPGALSLAFSALTDVKHFIPGFFVFNK